MHGQNVCLLSLLIARLRPTAIITTTTITTSTYHQEVHKKRNKHCSKRPSGRIRGFEKAKLGIYSCCLIYRYLCIYPSLLTRMNSLNGTVVDAPAPASAPFRWNDNLNSPLISDNDDDVELCRQIKLENPFESVDESYYRNISQNRRQTVTNSGTIPLASCATAAASISSAFNKKVSSLIRNVTFDFFQ